MESPPWYVITGGPCAGKTTLIKELKKRGYPVVEEAARAYIDQEKAKGKTLEEIRADEVGFQHAIIPMKQAAEEACSQTEVTFFDRGMHDSVAYLAHAGVTNDPILAAVLPHSRYRKVFLPDLLPLVQDGARTETKEEARMIHNDIRTAYETAGMEVVRVPVMSVKKRADFILKRL